MSQKDRLEIEEKEKEPVKIATIISLISIFLNLILGLSKIIVGKIVSSSAVFSDGVHSTGDVLTTLIALLSVWIAARKRNNKYNYGHERWASIACVVLAVILLITASEIIVEATSSLVEIINGQSNFIDPTSPLWMTSLILSIASIAIKLVMFFVTMYGAKKANSDAMKADGWHQIVDAFSSVAAIIALCGCIWFKDKNFFDQIFTYLIAIMVIVIGVETFTKAAKELTDHAIDEQTLNKVKETLKEVIDESKIKLIRSRLFSEKFYLDVYILQDENMTLKQCDDIHDKIKNTIFKNFEDCKNVNVISLPDDENHRTQEEIIR